MSRLQLRRPSRRAREMELKVTTLEGKEAGSVQLSDAIFGLEPRDDIIQRCVQLAAQQAPGRHAQDAGPRRCLAYRQEDVQAEGHRRCSSRLGPRAAVPRRWPCLRSGGSLARDRLPKKVRALALKHALSAKAKDGGLIVIDNANARGGQDQGSGRAFLGSRPDQCADHRRRRAAQRFRDRCAQHSEHRRAADPGHQRL